MAEIDPPCPTDEFKYYVSNLCIFEHEDAWTIFLLVVTVLSFLLNLYLMQRAIQATRDIKTIYFFEQPDATYSFFTLYILHFAKGMLVFGCM